MEKGESISGETGGRGWGRRGHLLSALLPANHGNDHDGLADLQSSCMLASEMNLWPALWSQPVKQEPQRVKEGHKMCPFSPMIHILSSLRNVSVYMPVGP